VALRHQVIGETTDTTAGTGHRRTVGPGARLADAATQPKKASRAMHGHAVLVTP